MKLKHATIIAIIGVAILTLTGGFYLYVNSHSYEYGWMYVYLNIVNVLGFALLLPFFITFYLDKKDVPVEKKIQQIAETEIAENNEIKSNVAKRYPALRTISGVYLALAIIACIAGFVSGIYMLTESHNSEGVFIAIGVIIGGLFGSLLFAAISEAIKLFIDIEHNTRKKQD